MPYPNTIAQNLLELSAKNHEYQFHMLWSSILHHHFPTNRGYGIALQSSITGTGTKLESLAVKVAHLNESVVVVVELKRQAVLDTPGGPDRVKEELVEHIEGQLNESHFPVIYVIAGTGLSWAAYTMEKTTHELRPLTDWSSNLHGITLRSIQIAEMVHKTAYERAIINDRMDI